MAEEEEYAPVLQQRGSPKSRDSNSHFIYRRTHGFAPPPSDLMGA